MKELNEVNKYYVSKERMEELRHFCKQYNTWVKARDSLTSFQSNLMDENWCKQHSEISVPVEKCAEAREVFNEKIKMVQQAAKATSDDELGEWILTAVTNGYSYDDMALKYNIGVSRKTYYIYYRKFFWALSKIRN